MPLGERSKTGDNCGDFLDVHFVHLQVTYAYNNKIEKIVLKMPTS